MQNLTRDAYITNEWLDREQVDLFGKSWVFVGTSADFASSGDYMAVQAGAFPLFILRLKEGTLSAFHNICRHRGTTLLEGKGNTGKSIICPYHRWSYALDGRLKGAPDMAACFPDLERKSLSLKPAAIGLFKGLVFANADANANFEEWISPIADLAWPHILNAKDVSEAASLTYDIKCNWKVFIENAIDGYHLAYLHEKTLEGPKQDENIWEQQGQHLLWYATEDADLRHSLPAKARKEYKRFLTKPLKDVAGKSFAGVYHLFPSTIITSTPYTFSVSNLFALSPSRTILTTRHWVGPGQSKDDRKHIPGYNPKTGIISSDDWNKPALATGDFQTEDVWICEKLQKGLSSPAFELGPLAKGAGAEDPITWFHKTLLESLG